MGELEAELAHRPRTAKHVVIVFKCNVFQIFQLSFIIIVGFFLLWLIVKQLVIFLCLFKCMGLFWHKIKKWTSLLITYKPKY